ncbi:MAG: enoyl-CoA hydratase/isomerase family protein [Gammaproteobacteria bacterium]|jgi:enoyl-CoA hydratase/carnithine racemase|nr:enoyl-CoA hydratase/isomerase family protein [Gammaproteobacteria bacterium]MBT5683118.1 enoyl-CoA hydratase/isomerase family protein [Gammaproteobacteria bacterium]MBT6558848.1 enoyl-CoA hydratase/isomerase family protein [Gammaproteobacteria bacterium]
MEEVLVNKFTTQAGGVWAEVVLNRPERKNAITGPLGVGLAERVNALNADDEVQAIMLRGEGGAFCSGLDLGAFNATPEPEWLADFQTIWRGAHKALFQCDKPIVGAMQRYAINGGAALAVACDYLVVGEQSFVQVGEVQIGMAAPYNLAWLNLRYSEAVIAEVVLLGDRLNGADMLRLGLANQSVDDDQVLQTATAICERFADFPSGAPAKIKQGMRARLGQTADEWFDLHTAATAGTRVKPQSMK